MGLFKKQDTSLKIIINYLNRRFLLNKNWLLAVTGGTGSGKSYSCLRLCEEWYKFKFKKPFPIENCCFSVEEMMMLFTKGNLKKGELVILEEAGCLIGSKEFMTKVNRLFNYFMQSFRSLNIGLVFNLPFLQMMDRSTRLLVHSHFITKSIDANNKVCVLKPFFIQVNQKSGKDYSKFLRVRSGDVGTYSTISKLNELEIPLPSREITKQYEKKKHDFVMTLGKSILSKIIDAVKKPFTERQQEVAQYYYMGMTQQQIADKYGIHRTTIAESMRNMDKKNPNWRMEGNLHKKPAIVGVKTPPIAPVNLNYEGIKKTK